MTVFQTDGAVSEKDLCPNRKMRGLEVSEVSSWQDKFINSIRQSEAVKLTQL